MSSYRNRNQGRRDYVPKWKQEEEAKTAEEKAVAKSLENTEDNFPSLGGKMVAPKTMWAGGPAKFKDLASEWRQKEEMEKVTGDQAVKQDTVLYPDMVLPTFNNVHRYTDEEEEEKKFERSEDEEDEKKFERSEDEKKFEHVEKKEDDQLDIGHTEEDDGWVTVQNKKPRKDKSAKKSEEIQARTEEDFETSSQGSDTVWNAHLPMGPGKKNNYS
jgi:hypothetical protein